MRGVRSAIAAVAVAAIVNCGEAAAQARSGNDAARLLLFSGSDLWSHGSFFHGGALWSPQGLDAEGLVFKLLVGGGNYRYRSGALGNAAVSGEQFGVFALPGWRFRRNGFSLVLFAGVDVQRHRLSPFDPGSDLSGTQYGARAAFELWYEPTPDTMIAADGSLSSIGETYSARAAWGWRIADTFFVGPEIGGFATGDYRQTRFGLHVTGIRAGPLEWSAAAGYASDNDERNGAYGRIGVIVRH